MKGLCIESLNLLNIDCEFKLSKKDLRLAMDVNGTSDILWSDVMNEIWCANQNNPMQNVNGELILFNGLFGSCFDCIMNCECMHFHFNKMKGTLNKKCKVIKLTDEVLPHHSKDMPLYSFDTLNKKLAIPIPGNLGADDFRHFEKDQVANVHGFSCGCGQKWNVNNKGKKEFHNLSDCSWHQYTGDVICSNYDKSPMYGLNKIRSYSELTQNTFMLLSYCSIRLLPWLP